MKHFRALLFLGLAASPALLAQSWEFGVGVGGPFYNSQTITNLNQSANASLSTGVAFSAWLGNNLRGRMGGELRYDYEMSDLKLTSGSTSATFGGNTQAIHYDFLVHFASQEAAIRPFVSAGAGVTFFRGTGHETPAQPLMAVGLLTKTLDTRALVSVGGGLKFNINRVLQLRVEVHDYMTPFPTKVIAPARGSKVSGWLMDFVPMGALAVTF